MHLAQDVKPSGSPGARLPIPPSRRDEISTGAIAPLDRRKAGVAPVVTLTPLMVSGLDHGGQLGQCLQGVFWQGSCDLGCDLVVIW